MFSWSILVGAIHELYLLITHLTHLGSLHDDDHTKNIFIMTNQELKYELENKLIEVFPLTKKESYEDISTEDIIESLNQRLLLLNH